MNTLTLPAVPALPVTDWMTEPVLVPENAQQVRESLDYLTATRGERAISYDTETEGVEDTDAVRLVQFATVDVAVVIRVEVLPADALDVMSAWISDALADGVRFAAQQAKFDAKHLDRLGVADAYTLMCSTDDTLTFARLLEGTRTDDSTGKNGSKNMTKKQAVIIAAERNAGTDLPKTPHGLKELTSDWLSVSLSSLAKDEKNRLWEQQGWTDSPTQAQRARSGWVNVDINSLSYLRYAGADVLDTARLWYFMHEALKGTAGESVITRERRILAWSCARDLNGFRFDVDTAQNNPEEEQMKEKRDAATAALAELGVSPGKATSVADGIERELTGTVTPLDPNVENPNRPQKRNDAGEVIDSHSKDVLKRFEHRSEVARQMLVIKEDAKALSSYGSTWMKHVREGTDRIFPIIDPSGSATGRMTMKDPSLLNVPNRERRFLIADPGHVFVSGDLKAVEVRLAGAFAGDPQMIQDLRDGKDPYGVVAQEVYGPDFTPAQRNACKPVLLGRMYGRAAESIAQQQVSEDPKNRDYATELATAKQIVAGIDNRWRELHLAGGRERAKVWMGASRVVLPTGRGVLVDVAFSADALNALVQGTGRELLVESGLLLLDMGYDPNALWLAVHDEWVLHVPEDQAEKAVRDLETVLKRPDFMGVPIECEVGVIGPVWGKI